MLKGIDSLLTLEQLPAIERIGFYDRVMQAHAIVLTGDAPPYANFVFMKGFVGETLVH